MTGSFTKIPQYFDTMLTARAPEKFTTKFMADLGFTSSNDRQFVNVLKAIGLLDESGTPTERYFKFLDQSFSKQMVAEGIKEAYVDLFMLNTTANKLTKAEVEGKFKTLTNGSKENATISHMASTFINLCGYADWSEAQPKPKNEEIIEEQQQDTPTVDAPTKKVGASAGLDLNYNIHIHLPATRDQAVYDALFASLTKHIPLK
ncbi:DUF5343 domain-containing protein [Christensenellaceae bacterium OttesenSCG-928-M15]|nr:DUF5343 domain-containing protein [Christensenellaceae bacterium OttesenSCG-928-M15]